MISTRLLAAIATVSCLAVPVATQTSPPEVLGRITDRQRSPVPGVTVALRPIAEAPPVVGVTDNDGRFRVSVSAAYTYRFVAALAGFKSIVRDGVRFTAAATEMNLTMDVAGVCECVTIVGPRSVGAIAGRVTDRNGLPLPLASVAIDRDDRVAGIDGLFGRDELPPGAYALTVAFPGFRKDVRAVVVEANRTTRVEIRLELGAASGPGRLSGYLTSSADSSGIGAARLTIEGTGLVGARTTASDASGFYELIDLPEGLYRIIVQAPGLVDEGGREFTIPIIAGERTVRDLKLARR